MARTSDFNDLACFAGSEEQMQLLCSEVCAASRKPGGDVACNGCQQYPIQGARWQCVELEDFDLCDTCHGQQHDTGLTFRCISRLPERSAVVALCQALAKEMAQDMQELGALLFDPRKMLGELHELLLAPIAGALKGAGEVLIIPHDDLLAVPWAALFDKSRSSYLIQRHVVRVAPSLRVARAAARAAASRCAQKESRAVVVGNPLPTKRDPLPGAQKEAEEVAQILAAGAGGAAAASGGGSALKLLLGKDASTSRVLMAMEGAGHVHYAGHAEPESLLLAHKEELSMTQVQETVKLAPGATAVLSGCETLLGQVRPEGTVGVARAFLMAGAGSVVASLWKVDDAATKELMCDFYKELYASGARRTSTAGVAEAMQRAMLAGIRRGWDPSKWAAFLVNGA